MVYVKSGLEIVELYKAYDQRIKELESAVARLDNFGYTQSVLQAQIQKLRDERIALETTRFQALDPITVPKSSLGGHDFFIS
ncbi:MAG TPA: hypothetical protein PKA10_20370 [Selenomonadales bacterium]|nr:hypothetical protein [Selenomonadales bacterium]